MRRPLGVSLATLLLAACAAETGPAPSPVPGPDRSLTPPPTATAPIPAATTPAVLIVHHSRGEIALTAAQAADVRAGRTPGWADLGQPAAALRVVSALPDATEPVPAAAAVDQVTRERDTLALVPATAVDERVRVVVVDGNHPLREPGRYPLVTPAEAAPPPAVTTVTIVGDVMLGRRVGRAYADRPAAPFEPWADRLAAADLTVGNLESTLSDNGRPTQGGDSFFAEPRMVEGLRRAGIDGVSLANNHLGDYGPAAMRETFVELDRAGIAHFGAGADLARARAPWIVERDGTRIAFVGTESIGETPAATDGGPGTNRLNMPPRTGPLDDAALDRIADDIAAVRRQADTVIVVPHWGTQYTHRPEASQRRVAERFAAAGADLVIGGHPHWVQGWDAIGDTTVVHSLGNFVFDMQFSRQVQEGLFVEIVLWDGRVKAVEPVPYVIRDHVPRPADPATAERILADARSTSSGPYAG